MLHGLFKNTRFKVWCSNMSHFTLKMKSCVQSTVNVYRLNVDLTFNGIALKDITLIRVIT